MGQAVDAADRKIGALQVSGTGSADNPGQGGRPNPKRRDTPPERHLCRHFARTDAPAFSCRSTRMRLSRAAPGAAKVGAGVGTAVIHHNGLPVRVSLRLQALQAGVQISRGIVDRDDDRDQRRHARIPADTGSTAKRFSWKGSFGAIRSSVHAGTAGTILPVREPCAAGPVHDCSYYSISVASLQYGTFLLCRLLAQKAGLSRPQKRGDGRLAKQRAAVS